MKAKKRNTNTPLPEPAVSSTMMVVYRDREIIYMGYNLDVMLSKCAMRNIEASYCTIKQWEGKEYDWELEDKAQREAAKEAKDKEKKPPKKIKEPKRQYASPSSTWDLMRASRMQYDRIKSAYYAGHNLWWLNEKTKKKFDEFRPNHNIVLACECEAGKTAVKDGGKWRPLQTDGDFDRAFRLIEEAENHNWDHQ